MPSNIHRSSTYLPDIPRTKTRNDALRLLLPAILIPLFQPTSNHRVTHTANEILISRSLFGVLSNITD